MRLYDHVKYLQMDLEPFVLTQHIRNIQTIQQFIVGISLSMFYIGRSSFFLSKGSITWRESLANMMDNMIHGGPSKSLRPPDYCQDYLYMNVWTELFLDETRRTTSEYCSL